MLTEFKQFLKNYGVIGLAVAVIIGVQLNALVSSLVNDLVMPLILQPALNAAGVNDVRLLSYNGIMYGRFIGALIDFLVVAFIIFLFSKYALKEDLAPKQKQAA